MEKIIQHAFLLSLIGTSLFACKKDNKSDPPSLDPPAAATSFTPSVTARMIIDSSSASINFKQFSPPLLYSFESFAPTLDLDLNADQIPDVQFGHVYSYGVTAVDASSMTISALNGSTSICSDSIYNMQVVGGSHLYTPHKVYQLKAKPFHYADTIKLTDNWRSARTVLFDYAEAWVFDSAGYSGGHDEYEHSDIGFENKQAYIAVRVKEKLGWIKISAVNYVCIRIYSYGLEK